jgi:hypothetical protein
MTYASAWRAWSIRPQTRGRAAERIRQTPGGPHCTESNAPSDGPLGSLGRVSNRGRSPRPRSTRCAGSPRGALAPRDRRGGRAAEADGERRPPPRPLASRVEPFCASSCLGGKTPRRSVRGDLQGCKPASGHFRRQGESRPGGRGGSRGKCQPNGGACSSPPPACARRRSAAPRFARRRASSACS